MTTPFGPSDDQLDGIYAGVAPAEQLEDVAAFMLEVKAEFSGPPADEVADRHLAAIAQEARRVQPARPLANQTVLPAEKNRWRRAMDKMTSLALKGATGVLAASMSMMGLAYAGVDLPGQAAEQALESVTGVELPNQEDSDTGSVAEDVKAVVDSDADKGCEFGQAVAAAASQNAKGDRPDEDRCAEGEDEGSEARGSKATGEEKSAAGRAKAAEKSGGASETGADNASTGSDRASAGADNAAEGTDRASSGSDNATTGTDRASSGSDNAGGGRSTAEENTGDDTSETDAGGTAGPATGDEKSAGGAANAGARP